MIKRLISLANILDRVGLYKEASELDDISKEMVSQDESKFTLDEFRVVREAIENAIVDGNPRSMDSKLLVSALKKLQNMPTL